MTRNAFILLISNKSSHRVLLIQENNGQWNIPGGRVKHYERSYDAAVRKFHEETGFLLNEANITQINRYNITHRNSSKTSIFIINSNQRFPNFSRTPEAIDLHYMPLNDLFDSINDKLYHSKVNSFRSCFKKSFNKIYPTIR